MCNVNIKRFKGILILGILVLSIAACLLYLELSVVKAVPVHATGRVTSKLRNGVPTQHQIFIQERVIYEVPVHLKIKGSIFLAHACTHGAYDFWEPSAQCSHCTGLAEEAMIAKIALKAGYIVIAANSSNRANKCWSSNMDDVSFVAKFISDIRVKYNALNLPLFALGASSGASFVWGMLCRNQIDGAILQVLSVDIAKYNPPEGYFGAPPVILNPMRRDSGTYNAMKRNFDSLSRKVSPSHLRFQECEPIPVTVEYLVGRLSFLTPLVAKTIVHALQEAGHISQRTGDLISDPTSPFSNWREVVRRATSGIEMETPIELGQGRSPLAKALNRAWAFHEYCATYLESDLLWMERIRENSDFKF